MKSRPAPPELGPRTPILNSVSLDSLMLDALAIALGMLPLVSDSPAYRADAATRGAGAPVTARQAAAELAADRNQLPAGSPPRHCHRSRWGGGSFRSQTRPTAASPRRM